MSEFTINKIDAIDSTNRALREDFHKGKLNHGHVLWTLNQTQGKGQRGAVWAVEANKNLTFSMFLLQEKISFLNPYSLNYSVALALKDCLKELHIPTVSIKWPNDILSGNKKLGGILIENVYRGAQLKGIIVGIGLNVNQEIFTNLPRASSMRLQTGRFFVLEEVLKLFLKHFYAFITKKDEAKLFDSYQASLYALNERREFLLSGNSFFAKVVGVSEHGQLQLQFDQGEIKDFPLKSIEWVY